MIGMFHVSRFEEELKTITWIHVTRLELTTSLNMFCLSFDWMRNTLEIDSRHEVGLKLLSSVLFRHSESNSTGSL